MKNKLPYALRKIVKERDRKLWSTYEHVMGIPFPTGDTEVHHVHPHGEGGEDREENLISLDSWTHRTVFHTTMGHADEAYQKKAVEYLESEPVKAWRKAHGEELRKIYDTIELSHIKKIRRQCLPAKRKGLPF
nr:MAG TPA: HNH endonuclease [Caudoviricetes sp.]